MNKIGFIGMGNMAMAIADGFISKEIFAPSDVYAFAPHKDKLLANAARIGYTPVDSASELAEICDTLIMACKPYQIEGVLEEISAQLAGKNLISIALGWDYARYSAVLPESVKIQFVMPNTPAQVGEGVFLFEESSSLEKDDRMQLMEAFGRLGLVKELPSGLMGIGGAITGCGPAFIDLYIEAMADAAVKYGIPRQTAYELVSQTALGTSKLQLETGLHPGVLKDAVCSPAGSTIRGVAALEETGFRASCIAAIDAVMNR